MNILVLTLKQILVIITKIIRNTLYTPYVTALIFYLFFVIMSVAGLFLSNDTGIDYVNNVIKIILSLNENLNFFDPNASYDFTGTPEMTDRFIIYCITGFALMYEFLTRVILFFKKDFDHEVLQIKILKIVKIFYGFTFAVSLIIFVFVFKEYVFAIILLLILLMNIATLLLAYKITSIFGFIIRILEEINGSYFSKVK